jgi:hypothetical protein
LSLLYCLSTLKGRALDIVKASKDFHIMPLPSLFKV